MMRMGVALLVWVVAMIVAAASTSAQAIKADSSQPIEIAADTLEVYQQEQKAIFSGNVVAVQGNINMKSARMIVFYKGSSGESAGGAQGISKIEADGGVIFASPTETARGQRAIYDVAREQISMHGDVILTRDNNVLKGTQLTYNLVSGKSVLSGAATAGEGGATTGNGRVRGLFVPKKEGN
jgi:lipopolysaccharide export system protein LptA